MVEQVTPVGGGNPLLHSLYETWVRFREQGQVPGHGIFHQFVRCTGNYLLD